MKILQINNTKAAVNSNYRGGDSWKPGRTAAERDLWDLSPSYN